MLDSYKVINFMVWTNFISPDPGEEKMQDSVLHTVAKIYLSGKHVTDCCL